MAAVANNLEGKQFGQLVALRPTKNRTHNKTIVWECKCIACGSVVNKASSKLVAGEVKSCGCLEHKRPVRSAKGWSGLTKLYSVYRHAAKSRNLDFVLTKWDFKKLVQSDCFYCGQVPTRIVQGSRGAAREHGLFTANGVDRIDSELGYTIDNCVPCCKTCNLAKSDMSVIEFRNWLKRAYVHNFVI